MNALLEPRSTPGMRVPATVSPAPAVSPEAGQAAGGWRVLWILARTGWRRLCNQFSKARVATSDDADASASPRQATPAKRDGLMLLSWIGTLLIVAVGLGLGYALVDRLGDQPVESTVGVVLLFLGLGFVPMVLAAESQNLGKVNWDLEWLFTFPVSTRTLFLARIVQFATVNGGATLFWISGAPILTGVFLGAGYGWWAIPLALAATAYAAVLIASVCVVVEIAAQKLLGAAGRKNLQAGLVALGGLLLIAGWGALIGATDQMSLDIASLVPEVVLANPLSLPAWLCADGWIPLATAGMMAAFAIAVPLAAVFLCGRLVLDGVGTSAGAYQGSRRNRGKGQPLSGGGWLSGIIGKDLRLLARDRALLVRTQLAPIVMCALYVLFNWNASTHMVQNPYNAAVAALYVGVYVLLLSAFQVLAVESSSLWMLYTVPQSLTSIVLRKTCLWGGFALLYGSATLALAAFMGMPLDSEALFAGAIALVGIVIYAFIAGALGVLAAKPLETDPRKRSRPVLQLLFFLLMVPYAMAIYVDVLWFKLGIVLLTALLAAALWEKARDRLPYLLDASASAPPRLSLAVGVVGVLVFVCGQLAVGLLLAGVPVGIHVFLPFVVGGGAAVLLALLMLHRVPNLFATIGLKAPEGQTRPVARATALGLAAGLVAALFTIAYVTLMGWLGVELQGLPLSGSASDHLLVIIVAVVAAPLLEEILFRGVVFRGMERSFRPAVAIAASALVFAMVHPPGSFVSVFVGGVVMAILLRRSGWLLPSIVMHAVHNAIMVGFAILTA
jgi:ABC-2 type transport system permease protein